LIFTTRNSPANWSVVGPSLERDPVPITVPKEAELVGAVPVIFPTLLSDVLIPDPTGYKEAVPSNAEAERVKMPFVATGTACPGRAA